MLLASVVCALVGASSVLAAPAVVNATLQARLQTLLDNAVTAKKAPGLAAIVFTANGNVAEAYSGLANADTSAPWTASSVFWPASMGKAAVSVIALRAAVQYGIGLDDSAALARILPEWAIGGPLARTIVSWNATSSYRRPITTPALRPVTLRMLLDHTAGMGYEFDSAKTAVAFTPADEGAIPSILTGDLRAISVPLVNAPDTKWLYGAQADWVAQFAIRVTGQTLRSLIQNWIATPLGLSADQFGTFLTPAMLANLVAIHTESPPGTFHATPIVMPQYAGVPPVGYQTLGSAPVYPTMPAFAKFLSTILATGPIFNLALSPFVQVAVDDIGSRSLSLPSKPVYISTNAFESNDLFQYESTRNLGWSLLQAAVERQTSSTGRSPGTLSWTGLANSHYFVDRARGIGMVVSAQFLPFWDLDIVALRDSIEKLIYGVA